MKASLNHIFRTIWSDALNTWVAVSELTSAKGKRSGSCVLSAAALADNESSSGNFAKRNRRLRCKPIAIALACCFSLSAQANPIGAQVVNGTVNINQSGNLLTVTNTPNAIINWQGFSIGSGETTNFIQQSASSSILNRVIGPDPSALLGTLTSNGRVFLINPAGIMVGQGAIINVGGLVTSTLNLSDTDFIAGKLNFGPNLNAGSVQNYGNITTPEGGTVYLVAPQVTNNGIINTPKGETILAAGNTVQLIDTSTPGVSAQVTGSNNTATNLGQILAESGSIGIVGAVAKNSGTLNASSIVSQGGRILLKASQDAYVQGQGNIQATGTTGGSIQVLGNRVAITDNATLDASGTNGGGTVLVGGDFHGANPAIQNATQTYVGPNTLIKADAIQNGNGGNVAVWSNNYTQFYGNISARGGAQSGDGGFVETSGKQTLAFAGLVNTTAAHGKTGTLLLDPSTIEILAGDLVTYNGTDLLSGGIWNSGSDTGAGQIGDGVITTTLASNNLELQATGLITVDAGVSIDFAGAGKNLTLTSTTGGITFLGGTFLNGGTSSLLLNFVTTLDISANPIFTNIGTVTATGGGTGTIAGPTAIANTWAISSANSGSLTNTSGVVGFSGVNSLTAGSSGDTFNFTGTGSVAMVTGAGGTDVLDYSGYGSNVTVNLSGANAGTTTTITSGFSGVSTITGNAAKNNTMGGSGQTYALDAVTADAGSSNGVTWTAFQNISDATGTVSFGNAGGLSGTAAAQVLDYSGYGSNVTVGLTGANAGTATATGGFSGVSTITGNAAKSNTMGGSGQTYALDAVTADAGSSNGVTWTAFQNISDATGTVSFGNAGGLSGTAAAQVLDYSGYGSNVTVGLTGANAGTATATGGFSGVSTITGNAAKSNTMGGSGQTYALDAVTADAGSSNGVTWTAFQNISDATGTVSFGNAGGLSGTAAAQVLDYSGYGSNVTVGLTGANAGTATATGGFSGVSTITGNAAKSNTMGGSGQTYALDAVTADAGSSNGVTWTAFQNISDATGTVSFGNAGGLSGTAAAQVLDYSGYGSNVTVGLTGANAGTATATGGFSGVSTITGNAAKNNTMGGSGQTYALDAVTADAGSSNGVTWTAFQNISDATGTVSFGNAGGLSGTAAAQVLDYSGYGSNVTVGLTGANAGTATATGGFSGVSTITGNAAKSNTMGGSGQTYALDAVTADAGSSNGVTWTAFQNISDATGTVSFGNAGGLSGTAAAQVSGLLGLWQQRDGGSDRRERGHSHGDWRLQRREHDHGQRGQEQHDGRKRPDLRAGCRDGGCGQFERRDLDGVPEHQRRDGNGELRQRGRAERDGSGAGSGLLGLWQQRDGGSDRRERGHSHGDWRLQRREHDHGQRGQEQHDGRKRPDLRAGCRDGGCGQFERRDLDGVPEHQRRDGNGELRQRGRAERDGSGAGSGLLGLWQQRDGGSDRRERGHSHGDWRLQRREHDHGQRGQEQHDGRKRPDLRAGCRDGGCGQFERRDLDGVPEHQRRDGNGELRQRGRAERDGSGAGSGLLGLWQQRDGGSDRRERGHSHGDWRLQRREHDHGQRGQEQHDGRKRPDLRAGCRDGGCGQFERRDLDGVPEHQRRDGNGELRQRGRAERDGSGAGSGLLGLWQQRDGGSDRRERGHSHGDWRLQRREHDHGQRGQEQHDGRKRPDLRAGCRDGGCGQFERRDLDGVPEHQRRDGNGELRQRGRAERDGSGAGSGLLGLWQQRDGGSDRRERGHSHGDWRLQRREHDHGQRGQEQHDGRKRPDLRAGCRDGGCGQFERRDLDGVPEHQRRDGHGELRQRGRAERERDGGHAELQQLWQPSVDQPANDHRHRHHGNLQRNRSGRW